MKELFESIVVSSSSDIVSGEMALLREDGFDSKCKLATIGEAQYILKWCNVEAVIMPRRLLPDSANFAQQVQMLLRYMTATLQKACEARGTSIANLYGFYSVYLYSPWQFGKNKCKVCSNVDAFGYPLSKMCRRRGWIQHDIPLQMDGFGTNMEWTVTNNMGNISGEGVVCMNMFHVDNPFNPQTFAWDAPKDNPFDTNPFGIKSW